MSHIVFLASNLTSALHGCLRLANVLQTRGHRVTFVSPAPLAAKVEANGFAFHSLAQEQALLAAPAFRRAENMGTLTRLRHRSAVIGSRRPLLTHWRNGRELETTLAAVQPDLVLVDYELHPHIIALAGRAVPLLLYTIMLNPRRAPGLPPLNSGLTPDAAGFGVRRAARWAAVLAQRAATRTAGRLLLGGTDRVSAAQSLARHHGLAFRRQVALDESLPLVYRFLPTLVFNAAELDLPHPPHANVTYTGPMIDATRRQPDVDDGFDAWWDTFVARRGAQRLLYATVGTYWSADKAYLQRLVNAVAARPAWQLLLSVGRSLPPAQLGPLPPNVMVFNNVPQLEIMRRADLCIHHGGISTINEAVHFGVPQLIYSTHHVDHDANSARAVFHKLGLRGELKRESPDTIRAKIDALLTWDPAPIATMQAAFARYGNGAAAAETIEAHLP